MYAIYFDYDGYENRIVAICKTEVDCFELVKKEMEEYDYKDFEKFMEDAEYSFHKIALNKILD